MINGKLIKVCGMRVADNIAEVESLEVDLMGFIFYHKSPRYVFDMPAYLPTKAKRVGVFVNETKEMVHTIADRYALDIFSYTAMNLLLTVSHCSNAA